MQVAKYRIKIIMTEPMLASSPANKDVYAKYIAGRELKDAEDRGDEVATLPAEDVEKLGTSVFHRDDKGLFLFDYHMRGFFKSAAEAVTGRAVKEDCPTCKGEKTVPIIDLEQGEVVEARQNCEHCKGKGVIVNEGITAYRSKIDKWLFVNPRRLYLNFGGSIIQKPNGANDGVTDGVLERPLRAQTAQGPRIALKRSEAVEVETFLEAVIIVLPLGNKEFSEQRLRDWLDYGQFVGLGEWRSGGWGRFRYEFEKVE